MDFGHYDDLLEVVFFSRTLFGFSGFELSRSGLISGGGGAI
jgi:hypothetical protein